MDKLRGQQSWRGTEVGILEPIWEQNWGAADGLVGIYMRGVAVATPICTIAMAFPVHCVPENSLQRRRPRMLQRMRRFYFIWEFYDKLVVQYHMAVNHRLLACTGSSCPTALWEVDSLQCRAALSTLSRTLSSSAPSACIVGGSGCCSAVLYCHRPDVLPNDEI